MEREITFMGVTTSINPLDAREKLVRKAELGLITPDAFWRSLRATWICMTPEEKEEEWEEEKNAIY